MISIKVYLPNKRFKTASVTPDSTLRDILNSVNIPLNNIIIHNNGNTEMSNLDYSMTYYNNCLNINTTYL